MVLVALSLGYWLGGRLADRHPHMRGLCLLALVAAACSRSCPSPPTWFRSYCCTDEGVSFVIEEDLGEARTLAELVGDFR